MPNTNTITNSVARPGGGLGELQHYPAGTQRRGHVVTTTMSTQEIIYMYKRRVARTGAACVCAACVCACVCAVGGGSAPDSLAGAGPYRKRPLASPVGSGGGDGGGDQVVRCGWAGCMGCASARCRGGEAIRKRGRAGEGSSCVAGGGWRGAGAM